MAFNNLFTCPDGHTFNANAKLRARCPDCGKLARRGFGKVEPPEAPTLPKLHTKLHEPEPKPEPSKPRVQLIKQGRPKVMPAKAPVPKTTVKAKAKPKPKQPLVLAKSNTTLVKRKTITTKGVTPQIKKRPRRTAVARHIAGAKETYADSMMKRARLF